MRILFVSKTLLAANIAYLLKKEGHDIKLYIDDKTKKDVFEGFVDKTTDWVNEIPWVGKDGLIIFDDVGFAKDQENLREQGYNVFGNSILGEELETKRVFGQAVFKECGMKIKDTFDFNTLDDAILFIKENPKRWVIKQNSDSAKRLNYSGALKSGEDCISILESYKKKKSIQKITLQEWVGGVELAVGRSFDGEKWVGPIKVNMEHKKFMPGDIGPTTDEMGTLAWFTDNEDSKIFNETLKKMEPFLRKANYVGEIDINCIVNENGAFPLESTSRFGSPIVHLHSEFQRNKWFDFLHSVTTKNKYQMRYKKGFGVVIVIAIPPFPYSKKIDEINYVDTQVFFKDITQSDLEHVHFDEVSKKDDKYFINETEGYILYVTGHGKTVEEAQKKAYKICKKIIIPKMMYRNDIGDRFVRHEREKLEKWGYFTKEDCPWFFSK